MDLEGFLLLDAKAKRDNGAKGCVLQRIGRGFGNCGLAVGITGRAGNEEEE